MLALEPYAGDFEISETIRNIAGECGIEFDNARTAVIDHFTAVSASQDHTLFKASGLNPTAKAIIGDTIGPVLYSGIGMNIDRGNALTLGVLHGNPTTYSAPLNRHIKIYPDNVGTETMLVTSMQARNNARVTFTGSMSMVSNKLMGNNDHGAETTALIASLTAWTFQEIAVLQVSRPSHWLTNSSIADEQRQKGSYGTVYRVGDHVAYSIDIAEIANNRSTPFRATDVELQVVLVETVAQIILTGNENGTFSGQFRAPDVPGVYRLRVAYRRPGFSNILSIARVTVRPFNHDEFERFLPIAYPFYTGLVSLLVGFVTFGIAFVHAGNGTTRKGKLT